MTTNFNTNHQMKMKTKVKRPKITTKKHHRLQLAFFKESLQQHRQLTQKHFPNNHKYKIFKKNNVKIYSCMANSSNNRKKNKHKQ